MLNRPPGCCLDCWRSWIRRAETAAGERGCCPHGDVSWEQRGVLVEVVPGGVAGFRQTLKWRRDRRP